MKPNCSFSSFIVALLAVLVSCPQHARADAPTHELRVTSAKTTQSDCGSGGCAPTCQIYLTVQGLNRGEAKPFQVIFYYKHPGFEATDDVQITPTKKLKVNALTFQFPGGVSATSEARSSNHQIGITCRDFRVLKIVAQCFDRYCPYARLRILPFRNGPVINAASEDIDPAR